ncbi:MAG: histone deacetylase [Anaerolineae bacterium]|nr:histone deacetylase [Anaerolineae bacterium]
MSILFVTHPRYLEHDLAQHPEHAGRIRAVWRAMEDSGAAAVVQSLEAPLADLPTLRAVHADDYLELLRSLEGFNRTVRLDPDTYANPISYEIARLSAGGVVRAVDGVLSGESASSLAVVRPPGHHALPQRAMGFCLLGNVAIAARHAQRMYGLERLLIVDYDVHHGNGTEAVFYDDPGVLFISTHQVNIFPGTGAVRDTGKGRGEGFTINIPMPGGCGDSSYASVFDEIVEPAARRFQPQMILVSVGHDAHWADPLASMQLSLRGYADLASRLHALAGELCGGKIAFVMEGGYHLDALGYGIANIALLLAGRPVHDPLGAPPQAFREPDISRLIAEVRRVHRLT